jgi:hypothetical protein
VKPFINVIPRQTKRIPWGWENVTVGPYTYVSKPRGDIAMPHLFDYFDWDTFVFEGQSGPLATTNFKSIFTTAARFLGYEKLLMEQPDLTPIAEEFLEWNEALLSRHHVSLYILGDDIAYNNGLFMSPSTFVSWLLPHYKRMFEQARRHGCTVLFHSDGDIAEITDILKDAGAEEFSVQFVGKMDRYRIFPQMYEADGLNELAGERMRLQR